MQNKLQLPIQLIQELINKQACRSSDHIKLLEIRDAMMLQSDIINSSNGGEQYLERNEFYYKQLADDFHGRD
jgi:hypothetical protein